MTRLRPRCALPTCRKRFTQGRTDQRFCADACRNKAYYMGRKAERVEQPSVNGHNRPSYTTILQRPQEATEPSTDEAGADDGGNEANMTDEEFMAEWMRVNMPDGPPKPIMPAPPSTDDGPYVVTIKDIPTRFPGTPLSRGRQ